MKLDAAPLSYAQQRLWLQVSLNPDDPAFHAYVALRACGHLDRDALQRSLDAVIDRHEVLRTTFRVLNGETLQVINPQMPVGIRAAGRIAADLLDEEMRRELRRPFDLAQGSLLRGVIYDLDDRQAILLLTVHHLVMDGWSMGVFLRELFACYGALVSGTAPVLPPLQFQYADFVDWERERLEEVEQGELEYWRERLRPPLAATEVLPDYPRPPVPGTHGATEHFRLDVLADARGLAGSRGASLFMVLLAAFEVVLQRHTLADEVVIGSPVAGRNHPDIEPLIGFFVNSLVLRTDFSGAPTFAEVLARVRETTLGAWDNQDIPFDRLVTTLKPERRTGRRQFFDLMFALQNAPLPEGDLPGLTVEAVSVVTDSAKFDMTVICQEMPDALDLQIEYNTELYEAATVRRLAASFEQVLRAACANPDARIATMPVVPPAELDELLHARRRRVEHAPAASTLHGWFALTAARYPDRIAVSWHGEQLSYRALADRAESLAGALQASGVRPRDRVAVAMTRCIDLVVGILGILKAGAAYVPIDPAYPTSRLAFMLADSRVSAVVTHAATTASLSSALATAGPGLPVIRVEEASKAGLPAAVSVAVAAADAAYIIYTSGSTGKPKGVVVTHENVTGLFAATAATFGFDANDVWTLFHSHAFDFSVWEMWGALLHGGRAVVVSHEVSRSPEALRELLDCEGVTFLNQTPSAFAQLDAVDARVPGGLYPALRHVVFGGEQLDSASLSGWFERHGDQRPALTNMYGITETTVHVTHRRIRAADARPGAPSVIGRAIDDLSLLVLDEHLQPVPIGTPGELFVGGRGVARGYLDRPGLTAERFVPDPFGRDRLYRTGDRVRWALDGGLEFLGRLDAQVKVRGFRIELGEIQHVLSGAGLRESVVVPRDDDGTTRLVAYGVAASPGACSPATLREACARVLPDYMVPAAYVLVDTLPLTRNGKLDVAALPAPDLGHDTAREKFVAPRTEIEKSIAAIWENMLGVDRVGLHDNFFALGGDSIMMLQMAARIGRAGFTVGRRDLIECQTVGDLAGRALRTPRRDGKEKRRKKGGATDAAASPAVAVQTAGAEVEDEYALTPLQEGLLFHSLYAPEDGHYVEQLHGRLDGELDVPAFARAWQTVIDRHPVLRTSFHWHGVDRPVQRVARKVKFELEFKDWRELAPSEQEARLADALDRDRARGFDFRQAPLMRVILLQFAPGGWYWIWTHHHLILDGWCLTLVVGEVLAAYDAYRRGAEPVLPERRPFRDFIDWLATQDRRAARDFWREHLRGFETPNRLDALERPAPGRVAASPRGGGTGERDLVLAPEETAALQEWARAQRVTLNTVVSACWARLLAVYSGSDDVVFGVTVSGRPTELEGFEHMVGLFINTLPSRVRLKPDQPLGDWLRDLQAQQVAMRAHEHTRLVDIQRESHLRAGESLFDALFVFENYPVDPANLQRVAGLALGPVTFVERTNYPLALAAIPGKRLTLRVYHDRARFGDKVIERVLRELGVLLRATIAAPARDGSLLVGDWGVLPSSAEHDGIGALGEASGAPPESVATRPSVPAPMAAQIGSEEDAQSAIARQTAFWRKTLQQLPEQLDLPSDRPRPATPSHRQDHVALRTTASLHGALAALARESEASLFMVLHAGLAALLTRLGAGTDVPIGSPVAGRTDMPDDPIGAFVNILVLRTDTSGDPSFRELVARVSAGNRAAYDHRDLPFQRLVDVLVADRSPSWHPLFQVMLALQINTPDSLDVPRPTAGLERVPFSAKPDLSLVLGEQGGADGSPGGISGVLEYATDLFDRASVEAIAARLVRLLEAAVAEPDRAIGSLDILSAEERHTIVLGWNDTVRPLPPATLPELFAAQVARSPDAVAVVCEGESFTYADLDARANQLAHHLRDLGVGPETVVGLCVERSPGMLVGLLGILKAGGAYLPLEPNYPNDRLNFMLDDAGARVLVTHAALLDRLPPQDAPVVCLDADWPAIARRPTSAPAVSLDPQNAAYVIYTSGSTGTPKGVVVAHAGFTNKLITLRDDFAVGSGFRSALVISSAFDAAIEQAVLPLVGGGAAVVVSNATREQPAQFWEQVIRDRVTFLSCVPSYLDSVLRQAPHALRLQHLALGGETFTTGFAREISRHLEVKRLTNLYGPTEATIDAVAFAVEGEQSGANIPIGRPLPNYRVYVLDSSLGPVPAGVVGELYIAGVGLARGYSGLAGLTGERFVANPYGPAGSRMYWTGDLARWRSDGLLEFVGRADAQLKIRGFRIEPGEIEAALMCFPPVAQAAVIARDDVAGHKRLAGYVVARDGQSVDPAALRAHLGRGLPDYMVPAAIVVLDRLPLTASGKLDRRALPAPDLAPAVMHAARMPQEDFLCALFAKVLGLERVGIDDNFFALGGDSILSLQIVSRALAAGMRISPRDLFEHPTVRGLAALVGAARVDDAVTEAAPGDVPLTPIQRWFFARGLRHCDRWNQSVMLEIDPRVTPDMLQRALRAVAAEHDALRLRYVRTDGITQRLAGRDTSADPMPCVVAAAPRDDPPSTPAAMERWIGRLADEAHSGLDLAHGPLARAVIFLSPAEGVPSRLLLVAHHLVIDGVSWRILIEDVQQRLAEQLKGVPPEPLGRSVSFATWARRLSAYAATASLPVDYWLALSAHGAPPLPVDREAPAAANTAASLGTIDIALDAATTAALLRQVPGVYHTRAHEPLLAAFAAALAEWSGSRRVLLDLEGHGREALPGLDLDLSRTLGWFTSIYPASLEVPADADPGATLCAVKEQLRQIPLSGVSFGVTVAFSEDADLRRRLAQVPQPQITFNYLGQLDQANDDGALLRLSNLPSGSGQHADERRTHVLDIVAAVRRGELEISFQFSAALHDRDTIARLAGGFERHLRALIDHCLRRGVGGHTPSDFPLSRIGAGSLAALEQACGPIEDLYALSPMQQGLFFHALAAPGRDLYLQQLHGELRGALDVDAFERAWRETVRRHAIFRGRFVWEGLAEPLFLVQPAAELEVTVQDWRALKPVEQDERIADLLRTDRRRGLTLDRAPLMRITLVQRGDQVWHWLWTHHHVLLDGWCVGLVLREVLDHYEARRSGTTAEPAYRRPYRDYIAWLQQQDRSRADAFWRDELADFTTPTRLTLPAAPAAAAMDDAAAAGEAGLSLSVAATARVEAWARANRLTLNTVLTGAWARLLASYSHSDDIVFGVTVAGRPAELEGADRMIGLFINTLPQRVRIRPGLPVVDWMRALQEQQLALRELDYCRLVDIQRASGLEPGVPLFETLIAFDNYPIDEALAQGFRDIEVIATHGVERTHYPLTLSVVPGRQLRMRSLFDRRRIGDAEVERILESLRHMLETVCSGQVSTVDAWSLVPPPALALTEVPTIARDDNLPMRFAWAAAVYPDRVAVSCGSETLTYRELSERASRLAHHLRQAEVRAESLVGVYLDRNMDVVVAILGVLQAGAAYVPIDPRAPAERVGYMIADASLDLIVTESAMLAALEPAARGQASFVVLDRDATQFAKYPRTPPGLGIPAASAAYVIYTSGSTGRPKGCVVTHANVLRLFDSTRRTFVPAADDVWTLFHSVGFDFSVWEIWGALLHGGRLVIVPHDVSRSPERLHDMLQRERVTVLNQTPSAFRQLVAVDLARQRGKEPAPLSLRHVIFGGEALQLEEVRNWIERRGEERPCLTNMYGITETTVHVTERRIRLVDVEFASGSVIGEAIPDLYLSVLDPFGLPLPLGVPGELHVAGAGVARGYLRRPGLTAERFLPGADGERLYRSGDLARPTGLDIEYLGRIDQQVKVRGFRIEPGEIEAALLDSPAVAMTTVQAFADAGDAQQRLVAYVVPRRPTSIEELREHLARKLPDYMIPAFFVLLDDLPLTVNGKVNRNALPSPDHAQGALATTFVAPRNEVERVLAEAFASGLELDRVGIHDNFFALGGDSIRSIQVLSRARAAGADLDFGSLFSHPTVAELSACLAAGSAARLIPRPVGPLELVEPEVAGALPADVEAAYPLTRLQQGMLAETLDDGATTIYHDVMTYHLRAPWNFEAMKRALAVISARHDVLRTSILLDAGPEPLQLVHAEAVIPVAVDDLVSLADDDQERHIEKWAREEVARPFDLDRAPLLRVQVHLRSTSTFQLSLSFHHAILDGWSVATLLTELLAAYAQRLGYAVPPLLAPPSAAFREYVALERRISADQNERSFWRDYVAGARPTILPRQPKAQAGLPRQVRYFEIPIVVATSKQLEQLAAELRMPLRTLVLAAHVYALGVICGESEVVTGLVTNGRLEQQDGERALGLFLGTLPFRLRFTIGSWRDLVEQVHDVEKQIERHRRFPLAEIQRLAGQPLFETDFNFVHFHVFEQARQMHDDFQMLDGRGFEMTGFALVVNFSLGVESKSIMGALGVDMMAMTAEQGARYAGVYGRVLERLAFHPDESAGAVNLLDPAEQDAVIAAGRARAAPPPACLHDLVGHQIARTPDAVAVTAGEQSLTFAGLDRRANQLAHVLIERAVRRDSVVAVCTASSCDRVVALLAVLRAGAAYLLLEPEQPRERLAAVLADAGVQVIVADDATIGYEWPQRADIVVMRPELFAGRPPTAPAVSVLPDNLAYVIFTSGSTGRPKGAQITHRGIASHMEWMRRRYPLVSSDRVLQKTPVSFDASVWEFWAPLVDGGSVVLVPDGSHRDPEFLAGVMRNERISILQLVPTLLNALLDAPVLVHCVALRRLFVGGEPLALALALRAGEIRPGIEVVNLYGPAETTIDATSCTLRAEHLVAAIGKPIDGMRAFVVDDAFHQIAPVGTDGDLYLGGAGLARGYAGRPGWTAASFVPDAHSGDAGARLYATGDRARWVRAAADTPDLELEFRGRADDQVKLYGQRVELGEIDAALRSHPAVQEAVTLLLDDGPRKRLVTHVVRATEVELGGELSTHLADRLPRALIPNAFVFHDALPQTAGGKIDRRALIAASGDVAEPRRPYVAPRSEIERLLVKIFAEVLGLERIGVSDDFYELGGDSILTLQIASRLRQAGWRLSPRRILEHPTVARVAAHAVPLVAGSKAASTRPAAGNVPLAPIQRDFFARLDAISEAGFESGRPAHWNQSMLLTVPAGIEAGAVCRAVDAVAAIHDATRLRFRRTPAGWEQHYVPVGIPGGIEFDSVDLSTGGNWQAELASRAEQAQAGLDLEQGPVGRAVYFSRGAERGRLLLVLHHLVVDVVSWRILLEDLAAAMASDEVKLPPPSSPYSDWVVALEGRARSADAGPWLALSETQTPSLALGRLAGAGLAQARRGVRADNFAKDAGAVRVRLDETSTAALLRVAPGRLRTRTEELLVAALFDSLSSADEASSLWLELEGHGREEVAEAEANGLDVSRTVGWFTALYPVCLQRSPGSRGGELLRAVKRGLRPLSARGVDFGALLYLSPDPEVRAQLAALPRREVAFNFLGRVDAGRTDTAASTIDIHPAPEPVGHDHDPAGQRHYLLEVTARVSAGELVIDWIYPGKIFPHATVELQAAEMVRSLKDLIASDAAAAAAPSDFPLVRVAEAELDALLVAHPDTDSILPPSPLQDGLLFHALDDDQPGVYLQQITAVLDGDVDRQAFEAAWDTTLQRHDALRASFHRNERDGHAYSIVHRDLHCPVTWLDWTELGQVEAEKRWPQLLSEDRARGFLLDSPPLMRLHVVRVGEGAWRLLWSHHHLLLDGWSLPLVLGDVLAHYRALTEGAATPVAPAGTFADYLAWLAARNQTAAEARWREVLRGFDTPSRMLLPQAAVLSSAEASGDSHGETELVLPEAVTRALSALARDNHLTLSTIMQCWWAHLVARFSGRRDVVFGVTVSGRSAELPDIDTTAGLFINTLPLRVEVPAGCTLLGLACRFERARATLTEHEDSRLVDVQRLADLPRGTQLFDSILIFQNYPLGEALAPLADFTVRDVKAIERTHYPLTCFVMPGRQLQVRLVYDATRFSREGVERVMEHGRRTLVATAESPMQPLEAVQTFPPRELALLVHAPDGAGGQPWLPLHERIARVAARDPHRTAVVCGDDTLSYRELVERSNRLAWALNRHGIGTEDLVGVCLDRSADMVVALLGVLGSGAAYVPLDPRFPRPRLELMLADSRPRAVVTRRDLAAGLPDGAGAGPLLVELDDLADDPSHATPAAGIHPESLAYVIFTSGSTGRPKGVQVTHAALANVIDSFAARPGLTPEDTFLAVTTLSFDIAALELFLPLSVGARLVIAGAEQAADAAELGELIEREHATVMQATPATWQMLVAAGWAGAPDLSVWSGGEALPADLAGELLARGRSLWNLYGPTETTIWSKAGAVATSRDALVLGPPIAATSTYVVNSELELTPPWVPGELLIAGRGLARGYRGQPGLTAERFVPDAFGAPGARAYRTGDEVRRTSGDLAFLGRLDQQVKIRGFRVELGEIEEALRAMPAVTNAVAMMRIDRPGHPRLVAYVVPAGRADPNLRQQMQNRLSGLLPGYMLPTAYVLLEALPLTPNGKIDRRALPVPGDAGGHDRATVAPRNEIEEAIAGLWEDALGIRRIGVTDSFFDLGGHSLVAASLLSTVRQVFRVRLPMRALFAGPTVEQMAHAICELEERRARVQRIARAVVQLRAMSPEAKALLREQRLATSGAEAVREQRMES
jgi:amino acid adenylation domain-containing protein/non-ribosomal peptide synthase protein (TIGR01720 family)